MAARIKIWMQGGVLFITLYCLPHDDRGVASPLSLSVVGASVHVNCFGGSR